MAEIGRQTLQGQLGLTPNDLPLTARLMSSSSPAFQTALPSGDPSVETHEAWGHFTLKTYRALETKSRD